MERIETYAKIANDQEEINEVCKFAYENNVKVKDIKMSICSTDGMIETRFLVILEQKVTI
jgi:hypothetical protein